MKKGNNTISSIFKGNEIIQAIKKGTLTVYESWKKLLASGVPPLTLLKNSGKNLIDYKIFGNSKQGIVPNEYQQVEYIESTGTQYIDTGIIPNQDTGFDIVFLSKNALTATDGKFGSIMGTRESSGVKELQLTTYSVNSQGTLRYNNNSLTAGLIANAKMHCTLRDKKYTNNIDISHVLTDTFESPVSLTIFALNQNGTKTQHGSLQLFSLKLYDGDTLVRDYVPCYRKSDNVIGLYDLVEAKFYVNNGTGTFVKGNNTPTPETPIEIESVGDKTKNLFQDISIVGGSNTIYTNGTITQKVADTSAGIQFKLQAYKNLAFLYHIVSKTITNLGVFYLSFTKEDTFNQICFGLNGTARDTTIIIDVSTLENGKTYTISANMLNITQGAVSWNNIQIEEGTASSNYEPYGYKIPVKVSGKNLLDLSQDLILWNTIKLEDNQSFQCAINNQYYAYIKINSLNDYLMEQKGNKITFSISEGIPNKKLSIVVYGKRTSTTNQFQEVSNGFGERSVTITIADDFTEITEFEMRFNRAGTPFTDTTTIVTGVQLELGEATEYEPYVEPITTNIYLNEPLRKIGDYADYTDFENKTKSKKIVELILDGTEEWLGLNITFEVGYFALTLGNKNYAISDICLSTHYEQKSITSSTTHSGINIINSSTYNDCRLAIRPNLETYNTIELFKQYLAEQYANGTPVKVYYALSNETRETIELPEIPTIKGTCILEVDTTIQPSNLEVVYKGK